MISATGACENFFDVFGSSEGRNDPLGNILATEGGKRGKRGLKSKTNGNTFLFSLVVGASKFS